MGICLHRILSVFTIAATLLTVASPQPSSARQWRATPQALAQDYAQIVDQRSPQEVVILMWLTPQMLSSDASSQQAREILGKYMLIGLVHAQFGAEGSPTFRKIPEVTLEPEKMKPRGALDEAVLPPAVLGGVKSIQALFQQTLGPLGRGTQWFVFDGADLPSCGKSGFAVPYDGVRYTYKTPIPGCPKA